MNVPPPVLARKTHVIYENIMKDGIRDAVGDKITFRSIGVVLYRYARDVSPPKPQKHKLSLY